MFLILLIILFVQGNILSSEFDYNKETDGIFIDRTQQLSPSKHYFNTAFNHFIEPSGGTDNFYVTCPFNRNYAILRSTYTKEPSQLVVLSCQGTLFHRQFFDYHTIQALALSAHQEMFAIIYQSKSWCKTNVKLLIQNVQTSTQVKYKLPKTFELACVKHHNPAIAFNKQNTHIIIWGVDTSTRKSYKEDFYGTPPLDYMIFSLYDKII